MKKFELLAPAGSFEALVAAVQNGCDAVYLGGDMYGARAFANNFNDEEMQKAIVYAHVYGVRVFVTVNTMIKEHEMHECIPYIARLQDMDVDALIIQDIGLFQHVHECFPELELHASTQMHIHNPEGIQMLKAMGATRVVVPRETSIEEVSEYASYGVDLEVFVQGALCVSYSGQCLMSAMTQHRSGNRGACAQNCRMQYTLEKKQPNGIKTTLENGTYLLSPKDLNTLHHVPELIKAGIASFKIEGRMKRPEYVALMVSCYRKAIDAFEAGKTFLVDHIVEEEMKKIFNRGFTDGHLFHHRGSNLMNYNRPNHMGIEIGYITGYHHDKVQIHLMHDLYQGDGIRILTSKQDEGFTINRIYKNGLLVNHALSGNDIEIDKTFYVEKNSKLLKTTDVHQLRQLQETYQHMKRRVEIVGKLTLFNGQKAMLEIRDTEGHYVQEESESKTVLAHTNPLSEERMNSQLMKTKDTPFDFIQLTYEMDNTCILPIREINQLRRTALCKLECLRSTRNGHRPFHIMEEKKNDHQPKIPTYIVVVHTKEQYDICKAYHLERVYIADAKLYHTLSDKTGIYERTSRVMKKTYTSKHMLIQENGGLFHGNPVICDTSLNMSNHFTAAFMFEHHAQGVCFSQESTLQECIEIADAYYSIHKVRGNFIYPIYGREELMISDYCAINALEKDSDKMNCGLCKTAQYALVDLKGHHYPLLCDHECRMHILNETPRNHFHEMEEAKNNHIASFLCVFTNENANECERIVQLLCKDIDI